MGDHMNVGDWMVLNIRTGRQYITETGKEVNALLITSAPIREIRDAGDNNVEAILDTTKGSEIYMALSPPVHPDKAAAALEEMAAKLRALGGE